MSGRGSIVGTITSAAPPEFPWEALLRDVPAAFFVDRTDGTSLWASENLQRVIGCSFDEWKRGNEAWFARVHPEDREAVVEQHDRFLRTGDPRSSEYRIVLPDGRVRWILDHALRLGETDAREPLVQGVLVDVTDERGARESEERAAKLFRAMVENAREAVTIVDAQGMVTYHNPSMGHVIGRPPEWFAGRSPLELMPPEDAQRALRILAELQQTPGARLPGEFHLRHSDGSWRIVEGFATNLLHDPSVRGIILNYRDVTDERARQKRRRSEVDALLNAEAEQRARIAEELHDDTIQVMVASLVEIDRVKRQLRDGRLDEAQDTLDLARDVLAAATERTRKLTFELRPQLLEAAGLRAAVGELTRQLADHTGAEVDLHAPPGRYPSHVETLAYRTIREALINIRTHARARHAAVTIVEREGALHVEIRDDGSGFTQTSAGLSDHFGIEISRERVEAAGGAFHIHSRPSRGTTVSFDLPLGG